MENSITPGKIIIINGPSSSGKTTLALALQKQLDVPFIRFSFDLFLEHNILPMEQIRKGIFSWDLMIGLLTISITLFTKQNKGAP